MNFFVALRKEWQEQWRTSRLLIVGAVLVAFGLTSPLLAKYTPEMLRLLPNGESILALIPPPTVADAVAQYIKNMSQFGIILALLMSMGAVAQEKDKGTAAMMLTKPLPRWAFLAAKFAALALVFVISLAVAGAGCYYYTLLLFEAMNLSHWVILNGLMLVVILVYVAMTLFASALTRSASAAGGVAFGLLIVLNLPGALPKVGEYLPGQLTAWGAGLMLGSSETYWPALGVSLGLIAVSLAGAWAVFEKQEL